jgi:hypothetical protein
MASHSHDRPSGLLLANQQHHQHHQSSDHNRGDGFLPATANHFSDSVPFLYRIDATPRWALFCVSPKAGSTLWKRAFIAGLADQGFAMRNEPGEWHGHPLPYNISAHDASLPRAPRLMLVRHPHARLLSAYLGKAVTGRFTVAGWGNGTGFRGFVDAVTRAPRCDEGERCELDRHFALQVDQCGIGALRRANATKRLGYRYLRVEEMGHWYRDVVCTLGLAKTVSTPSLFWGDVAKIEGLAHHPERATAAYNHSTQCFVRTGDCGCDVHCRGHHCNASHAGTRPDAEFASFRDATAKLDDYYDAELAQRVNEWAEEDLVEFGYRPWRPGQHLT